MNTDTLKLIKQEIEKIENEPGFGKVTISIEHGEVRIIQPAPTILIRLLDRLDKNKK